MCCPEVLQSSAESFRLKGYEEQQQGNIQDALRFYTKALALGFDDAQIFNDIGVVYEQLDVIDKAEEYYLKAIEIDPDYLAPYTNLAFFYKAQGRRDRAAEFFQRRLELGSEDDPWQDKARQELYKLRPELLAQQLREEAQQLTRQVIDQSRDEFSLQIQRAEKHYQRGQQLLLDNDFDSAIAEFENALILTPGNPKALKARDLAGYEKTIDGIKRRTQQAIEKLDAGDLEGSLEEYQKILTLFPNDLNQQFE